MRPRAVAGDTFTFEVADVLGQRRRAEFRAGVADDARLDDDAARGGTQRTCKRRGPAPPEARADAGGSARPEAAASVPGSPGGLHDLADEALRLAAAAVPDAPWPDMQIIVTVAHCGVRRQARKASDGAFIEGLIDVFDGSASLAP